jgi:hypothetical protein
VAGQNPQRVVETIEEEEEEEEGFGEGCMGSIPFNTYFGYQLNICTMREENYGKTLVESFLD